MKTKDQEFYEELSKMQSRDVIPLPFVFNELRDVNVNKHTEKKNGLTYLSWAWAWDYVKSKYPNASYEVREWYERPYLHDEFLGYIVQTSVTINDETLTMRLPVMDGANKAMKKFDYTYTTKYGEKTVTAATMFDINTAIMRCLVKNLAMFGLGLYIYSGEDLPEADKNVKPKLSQDRFNKALESIIKGEYKGDLKASFDLTKEQLKALEDATNR